MPETDPELPLSYPFPMGDFGSPPPLVHWAREHRPVCPVRLPSGASTWMVTRKADVATVLTDRRFSRQLAFHGAPRIVGDDTTAVAGSIFNLDPPEHTKIRRLVGPYYTRSATEGYRQTVSTLIDGVLEEMAGEPGRSTDLVKTFATRIPPLVGCALLKVPPELRDRFAANFSVQTGFGDDTDALAAAGSTIGALTRQVIDARQRDAQADRQDPIGALLTAYEQGDIGESELFGTASYLIVVGVGSLVSPMATGPLTLLRHPEALRACRKDPALWPRATEEVLRYHHNGVLGFPRIAREDVDMHGVTIRRGDAVSATMLGATWDPEYYSSPGTFDIHRSENADATFGAGPHYCLGSHQARMVLTLAYRALFERFPDLALAVPEDEITFDEGSMFILPDALPVVWTES